MCFFFSGFIGFQCFLFFFWFHGFLMGFMLFCHIIFLFVSGFMGFYGILSCLVLFLWSFFVVGLPKTWFDNGFSMVFGVICLVG